MKKMITNMTNKVAEKVMKARLALMEERGASDLVTIIAIIVVIIAAALIFRGVLANIINTVGAKVINWINGN